MSRAFCQALCIGAAAALLSACGESASPIGVPRSTSQGRAILHHAPRGKSWTLPEAMRKDLLYISDRSDVYVYSYPKAKLVGMLTGLQSPAGICPDKSGNIWIANYVYGGSIVEYAHGGTQPINSLVVPNVTPQECSIDPTSGNLAVVGYEPDSDPSALGSIIVYPRASGMPTIYHVPWGNTSFCTYDDNGNLFVDGFGFSESPEFAFAELKKGAKRFKEVDFGASGYPSFYPTPVRWDGRYVAVGAPTNIVRYTIRHFAAVEQSQTQFDDLHLLNNAWIQGNKVIVLNLFGNSYPPVQIDRYPAGGYPIKTISGFYGNPFGVAVSTLKNRDIRASGKLH